MGRRSSAQCLAAWTALTLNSCCLVSALTAGLADELDKDCAAQLQSIYDNYYGPPAGTICQTAIQTALTEADPALCPPSNVTVPCFNQAQTQWMAFVTTCDVFYWSDYSRDPVVSPVIVPGTGSSTSSSSSGATINVPSTGNNAEGEGRRLLQNTAVTGLLAAADSSGAKVLNGCFPTLRDPRHFYLWLQGEDLGYSSGAGQQFATQSFLTVLVAAIAAVVLLLV